MNLLEKAILIGMIAVELSRRRDAEASRKLAEAFADLVEEVGEWVKSEKWLGEAIGMFSSEKESVWIYLPRLSIRWNASEGRTICITMYPGLDCDIRSVAEKLRERGFQVWIRLVEITICGRAREIRRLLADVVEIVRSRNEEILLEDQNELCRYLQSL